MTIFFPGGGGGLVGIDWCVMLITLTLAQLLKDKTYAELRKAKRSKLGSKTNTL